MCISGQLVRRLDCGSNSQCLWVRIPVETKASTNCQSTILKYIHKYLKYSTNIIGLSLSANERIATPTSNKMAPMCANSAQSAPVYDSRATLTLIQPGWGKFTPPVSFSDFLRVFYAFYGPNRSDFYFFELRCVIPPKKAGKNLSGGLHRRFVARK